MPIYNIIYIVTKVRKIYCVLYIFKLMLMYFITYVQVVDMFVCICMYMIRNLLEIFFHVGNYLINNFSILRHEFYIKESKRA